MTETQRKELLDKVKNLVAEHSIGFIFAIQVEVNEYREDMAESTMISIWGGDLTIATGLATRMQSSIDETSRNAWREFLNDKNKNEPES